MKLFSQVYYLWFYYPLLLLQKPAKRNFTELDAKDNPLNFVNVSSAYSGIGDVSLNCALCKKETISLKNLAPSGISIVLLLLLTYWAFLDISIFGLSQKRPL